MKITPTFGIILFLLLLLVNSIESRYEPGGEEQWRNVMETKDKKDSLEHTELENESKGADQKKPFAKDKEAHPNIFYANDVKTYHFVKDIESRPIPFYPDFDDVKTDISAKDQTFHFVKDIESRPIPFYPDFDDVKTDISAEGQTYHFVKDIESRPIPFYPDFDDVKTDISAKETYHFVKDIESRPIPFYPDFDDVKTDISGKETESRPSATFYPNELKPKESSTKARHGEAEIGDAREGFSEIDHEKRKEVELNEHMEARFKGDGIIKMMTQMDEVEQQQQHNNEAHSSSHMNHINPIFMVFFTINDLKQGKKLPIYFPKRDPSKYPPFLTKEEADPIPFSLKELPEILSYFSFPSNSPQAQAMKETLQACEVKPIKGETKLCVNSRESMVDFLTTAFGSQSHFKALTTSHLRKSNVRFQNYTLFFEAHKKTAAPRVVVCHTMVYTYAVYYCHYQQGDNIVLHIPLRGENGDLVQALALCHMDTSQWSPSHPAFQSLNIQPGSVPVCHFFPADDLVWIPLPAT